MSLVSLPQHAWFAKYVPLMRKTVQLSRLAFESAWSAQLCSEDRAVKITQVKLNTTLSIFEFQRAVFGNARPPVGAHRPRDRAREVLPGAQLKGCEKATRPATSFPPGCSALRMVCNP